MRIVYLVTICMLLASCGQKFSLQKRKYTKGFYAGSRHKISAAKKEDPKPVPVKEKEKEKENTSEEATFTGLASVFNPKPVAANSEKSELYGINPRKLNFTKKLSGISSSHRSLAPIQSTSKKLEEKKKNLNLNTKKGRASDLMLDIGLTGLALLGISLLLCGAVAKPSVFTRSPIEALTMIGAVFLTLVIFTGLMLLCNSVQLFNLLFLVLAAILNS